MLSTNAGGLPYSNPGDVGVWLIILGATIIPSVGVPGCTIVVAESHDLGLTRIFLCINYLYPEK